MTVYFLNQTDETFEGGYVELFITPRIWHIFGLTSEYIDVFCQGNRLKYYLDYYRPYEQTAVVLIKLEDTDGNTYSIEPNKTIAIDIVPSTTNNAQASERLEYMIYPYAYRYLKKPHAYVENPLDFVNSFLFVNPNITVVLGGAKNEIRFTLSTRHDTDTGLVKASWIFERNGNVLRLYHMSSSSNEYNWLEYQTTLAYTPKLAAFVYTTRWTVFDGYETNNFEFYRGTLPLDYNITSVRLAYGNASEMTATINSDAIYNLSSYKTFWRFYNTTLTSEEIKALGNSDGIIPLFHWHTGTSRLYITKQEITSGTSQMQLKDRQHPAGTSRISLVDRYPSLQTESAGITSLSSEAETPAGISKMQSKNTHIPEGTVVLKHEWRGNEPSGTLQSSLGIEKQKTEGVLEVEHGIRKINVATVFTGLGSKLLASGSSIISPVNPSWIMLLDYPDYRVAYRDEPEYWIKIQPEGGENMAMVLETGNTGFYKAIIYDKENNQVDPEEYHAKLYNESKQAIADLPTIKIGTGTYNIIVDSSNLNLEEGRYYIEFRCVVGGYQILNRETLYLRFLA